MSMRVVKHETIRTGRLTSGIATEFLSRAEENINAERTHGEDGLHVLGPKTLLADLEQVRREAAFKVIGSVT
jgi:hypothetical protein